MKNIFVLDKNYKQIGTLSNEGANPQAPYFNDLYVQELETGADTYEFSTMSSKYTQDMLEIGNHIMFNYRGWNELFTITSLEYSHSEGYKTIGVYAEGIGFELLEVFMKRPENEKENGTDNDNDGDDNYDDEYADVDDLYIDENGNIIYNKYGKEDYADPENISIDGNGNIIYRRNKRNRKNDSLEFKNISYSRFLSILLKNTGWSYVCQPGLEDVKHDITVRYDRNIYAVLQDSMQDYKGVELAFVHKMVGGEVQKIIMAYKDGGRGSFVGKRFEYGVNVKGITKTQEVANSEDDTVYFVDNVGIEVTYDVDFALKSEEVTEIEIGDTHYVIDKDFYPPMTIKARIGKIEISFSDPTRNKIYLANNKKVRGSALEDEGINEDDINDILDDYDFDNDYVPYHLHDTLYSKQYKPIEGSEHLEVSWSNYYVRLEDNVFHRGTNTKYYHLGDEKYRWDFAFVRAVDCHDGVMSPRYFGHNYHVWYDRSDMVDVTKITNSSKVTKQDLLNFIVNDLNVYEYSSKKINEVLNEEISDPDPDAKFGNQIYLGLLSEDVFTHGSPCRTSKVGARIGRSTITDDANNSGEQNAKDGHNKHTYNIPALLSCLIGAFQYYVSGGRVTTTGPSPKDVDAGYDGPSKPGIPGSGSDNPGDPDIPDIPDIPGSGTIDLSDYATIEYVDREILEAQLSRDEPVDLSDYATKEYVDDKFNSGTTPGTGNTFDTITVRKIQGPDPGEGQYNRVEFADGIKVDHIWCANEDTGAIHMEDELVLHNGFELHGDLDVDGNIYAHNFPSSDKSLKENIRYIDAVPTTDDLLEKADLYDFIVNQVNLCEYNFIGDTADKIGFIANDYEGTKVGDKIVSRNKKTDLLVYDISNLLFATIGALQEEVRTKDEQIANLESRLARLEALLGINNNDN